MCAASECPPFLFVRESGGVFSFLMYKRVYSSFFLLVLWVSDWGGVVVNKDKGLYPYLCWPQLVHMLRFFRSNGLFLHRCDSLC